MMQHELYLTVGAMPPKARRYGIHQISLKA